MNIKRHYVYELRAKTSSESIVFYVGKGVGDRVENHVHEVIKKLNSQSKIDSDKQKLIAQLIDKNTEGEIEELIVGRFNSDEEAKAVEATLIDWIYGKASLTNISSGSGSAYIRKKNDFDFDNQLNDTRKRKHRIEESVRTLGLAEAAEELRSSLSAYGLGGTTEPAFIRGQDYTFNWSVPNTDYFLEFKLNMSSDTVVINARANKGFDRQFVMLAESAGYTLSKKQYPDVFAPLAEYVKLPHDDIANPRSDGAFRFSSYCKGVPRNNVEDMVRLSQDFRVRINLAKVSQELENGLDLSNEEVVADLVGESIDILRQRPEAKVQ